MLRNFLIALFLLSGMMASGQDKTLLPYMAFIEKQKTDPVDYVFELFDKYDIVILGERDHRDTTQYVLFEKIMSDPRFIEKVGHVFTEVGVCNQTDNANRVLKGTYASEDDFIRDLRHLYQHIDYEAIWEKYNYWYFLNSIYRINRNLRHDQKITLHLTDVSFDWSECQDSVAWKKFLQKIDRGTYRDVVMGVNIIQGFNRILQDKNESRKKAMVILNRPHSYQNYTYANGKDIYSLNPAASYVFDYFPNQVANVMINWLKLKDKDYLIADGKWDAAFHCLKNPSIGFDMKDSPLGEDVFDHYDRPASDTRYRDIYTGFIFYRPIEEWAFTQGIPGIVTEDFIPELLRRERVGSVNGRQPFDLDGAIKYYDNKRTYNRYANDGELIKNLEKWKVKH